MLQQHDVAAQHRHQLPDQLALGLLPACQRLLADQRCALTACFLQAALLFVQVVQLQAQLANLLLQLASLQLQRIAGRHALALLPQPLAHADTAAAQLQPGAGFTQRFDNAVALRFLYRQLLLVLHHGL